MSNEPTSFVDQEGLFFLATAQVTVTDKVENTSFQTYINVTWKNEDYKTLVSLLKINELIDECAKQFLKLYPQYNSENYSIDTVVITGLTPLGVGTYEEFLKGLPIETTEGK